MFPEIDRSKVELTGKVGIYVLVPLYTCAMFIYPMIAGRGSWTHVHQVWYDWQSLNVGMLALTSSVIVFQAAKYHTDDQRRRDFRAAQAFLPSALSELTDYLRSCATVLESSWNLMGDADETDDVDAGVQPLPINIPELPLSYAEVFAQCIKYAEPKTGDFLAKILADLQVHYSRIAELGGEDAFQRGVIRIQGRDSLMAYLLKLGVIQACVNRLFPFARNEESFDGSPLLWDELRGAYHNLGLHISEYEVAGIGSLEAFSRRWIDRHSHDQI